ncbi:MAG: polyprenyl synthetase family protein [Oligoflexus sp.]
MNRNPSVQAVVNFKEKSKRGVVNIPAIGHAVSPQVAASIAQLEFDLGQWEQNPRIGDLLSRTVLNGGKRLRPLVNFLMADFFGVKHEDIAPYARVVELVHAATLAHDDVIDNASVRRGAPSINAVATNKHAVLAGDYLLAYAVEQVARSGRGDLVLCLTRVISDLAEGEWLQIENSQANHLNKEDIENVALKKTGSVLRWCCEIPPRLQRLDEDLCQKAAEFGELLGVAFQMTDDILDFKRRDGAEFADIKNGVINSVIYEALSITSPDRAPHSGAIAKINWDAETLAVSLERVTIDARKKLDRCRELLKLMEESTPSLQARERNSAQFAMSCLIEYLANRV